MDEQPAWKLILNNTLIRINQSFYESFCKQVGATVVIEWI